jgi:uncharacterized protein
MAGAEVVPLGPPNQPLLTDGPGSLASLGSPARGRAAGLGRTEGGLDPSVILVVNRPPRYKRNMLRSADGSDLPEVLELNRDSETETSPLDPVRLRQLASRAAYFKVSVGEAGLEGFLLAFREDASHDSLNFLWFKKRFERFLYIDRVIVRREKRQRGVASQLYADAEEHAVSSNVPLLACEINLQPSNPHSLAFHRSRGFSEVDTLELSAAGKLVSLQVKYLDSSLVGTACRPTRRCT